MAGVTAPRPADRLAELGLHLPAAPAPAATYVPARAADHLLFTSGQIPLVDGALPRRGRVGAEVSVEDATQDARTCALNALAVVAEALGDLDRVAEVVKVTVFVAAAPGFTEPHVVANGASELLAAVLGESGQHARSAVGVAVLPLDAPVEVEVVVRTRTV